MPLDLHETENPHPDDMNGGKTMRRLLWLLVAALTLTMVVATPATAKKPVVGEMDLEFNLLYDGSTDLSIPTWVGTITFDDDEYGMAFFPTGSGKPFDTDPNLNVHFFEEVWVVYETLDSEFDNGALVKFEPGDVVLQGVDSGITNITASKYHMTGTVDIAEGPFEAWEGRKVYMRGSIDWYEFGAPHFGPGIFRLH